MAQSSVQVDNILELIGGTPLVRLRRLPAELAGPNAAEVWVKCEQFNPGGSVKDRIALAMIEAAEREGRLVPGRSVIVEATSGNTGVALAVIAASRGYRCIVVMPEGYGAVKAKLMTAAGARVVRTPADQLMAGAVSKAAEIAATTPGSFIPSQFHNPVNPQTHFQTTGPEIAEQAGGRIDAWVAGVGTTGTFTGVARYLSTVHPGILRVAVEPQGSILGGGPAGHHDVEGIGLSQIWPILDRSLIDDIVTVGDADAFETCRVLAREEGLFAGGSSGAAAYGALQIAKRLGPGKTVVTLFPDGAERYPDQGIFPK